MHHEEKYGNLIPDPGAYGRSGPEYFNEPTSLESEKEFMDDTDRLKEEMHGLCEAVLNDCLTVSRMRRLEHLVKNRESLRRYYVDYMRQHILLLERQKPFLPIGAIPAKSVFNKAKRSLTGPAPLFFAATALSILVLGAFFLARFASDPRLDLRHEPERASTESPVPEEDGRVETETFATLQVMAKCVWGNPETEIVHGDRVGPGLIHLLSGIVQLRYDNGVALNIEGPSKIELSRIDRCFLHFGTVSAEVSPSGIGFTVDTNSASIEDRGTVFGVKVTDENCSEVRVFSGHVEVRPIGDQISIPLTTGRRIQFTDTRSLVPESEPDRSGTDRHDDAFADNEYVRSTADGLGKEACVISGGRYEALVPDLISKSETLTLVKNASSPRSRWHRKAYFSIDVGEVPVSAFSDAVLELTFARTGVGFESRSADHSSLSVYGLLDETGDAWKEETIDWSNAPANLEGAAELDLAKVIMIGQIEVSVSDEVCIKRISGNALRRFLETDTNKILTFIIVCETREKGNMGYAYGFANRHHPELSPPTLRLIRDQGENDEEPYQEPPKEP